MTAQIHNAAGRLPALRNRRFAGLIAAAALLPALCAQIAFAQGTVRGSFGDWEHRCEAGADVNSENCILYQNVADDQNAQFNLVIVVIKITDAANRGNSDRRPVLRVIAPLGVLLPRGLGLKIDTKDVGTTGFVRCVQSGCVAEADMDAGLVRDFSAGETALFSIFQTETEGKGLPINLKGFADGLKALK